MNSAPESIARVAPAEELQPKLGWTRIFTSDSLPEAERYRGWRDADIAGYAKRFDTWPLEPFAVTMDRIDLGPLSVGGSQFSAQEWSRERSNIVADGCDDIIVNVRHCGGALGDMNGRTVVAPAGSIVLADMAQVGRHESEASVTSGFALPRALAQQMLPSVRGLHGHVVAPGQAALLVSHMAMIRQHADRLPASSGPLLARTIVDLLTMAVHASMGGVPADAGQHDRGLRHQLCAAIEQHLGSPSLNTVRLSRMIGVSRSTLYRLLQDEGGVQAYIRTRRLDRVAATLRDGGRDTIAVLAERWGFCDAAYLGRAFREVYGVTPGDYRAVHGTARS